MIEQIKPGLFGKSYTADERRRVFDFYNHQILSADVHPDFVFIGDSITEYWDLNLYFPTWGYLVNRGVGGDISDIVRRRFLADVLQLKPRNAVLLVGCNDLMTMHGDAWHRTHGEEPEKIVSALLSNIEEMIKACTDTVLYLCSVLPSDLCVPYDASLFNDTILKVNQGLKALCDEYGVTYVDYHAHLTQKDGKTVRKDLTYDGVHPTPECYRIMAEVLCGAIRA